MTVDPDRTPDNTETPTTALESQSAPANEPAATSEKPEEKPHDLTEPKVTEANLADSDAEPPEAAAAVDRAEEDAPEAEAEEDTGPVEPLEFIDESLEEDAQDRQWYILKIAVNREDSIRDALIRRLKREGLDRYFGDIVIPTEDVVEFTKNQKRKVVKKKLYPGYLLVHMHVNDATWFVVRETPGIGDFTTSGGKPAPMAQKDVDKILRTSKPAESEDVTSVKMAIPFKKGDRVRVKEGYFQNSEGDVEAIDESNGRVTVLLTIFGRNTPVEIDHWHIEAV
jgi:transcriptional antiterminator NusG